MAMPQVVFCTVWSYRRGHLDRRALFFHAVSDVIAQLLVDLSPVFDRAIQHVFGDAALQVTDDVADPAGVSGIVKHITYERPGLAEVVVLGVQGEALRTMSTSLCHRPASSVSDGSAARPPQELGA